MIYNVPIEDFLTDEAVLSVELTPKETKQERRDRWDDRKSYSHPVNDMTPWDRIDKILKKYLGKPFDDAFSYYCKQVPVYQQHIFLEYFSPDHYRWADTYYLNENGIIEKGTRRWRAPKKPIFYSIDYKTELRHKITGKKKSEYYWMNYTFTRNNYKEKYPRAKSYYEAQTLYDKEFEPVIISGWAKEFDSKKDPEYKRLMAEKRKAMERTRKILDKQIKARDYAFVHTTPEQLEREQQNNLLKIRRKGFDPDTSFHRDSEN